MVTYREQQRDMTKDSQVRVNADLYTKVFNDARAENLPVVRWVHIALCEKLGIDPRTLRKSRRPTTNGDHEEE
jgi:hypothetical protein